MKLFALFLVVQLLSFNVWSADSIVTVETNKVFSSFSGDDVIFISGFEAFELDCLNVVSPPGVFATYDIYRDLNDGFNFGESTNTSFLANIRILDYLVLSEFSYPEEDSRRRIIFVDAPTNFNLMDQATLSVSECPGDFTATAACVILVNNQKTVFITTKDTDPNTNPFCKIDPAKTYYFNLIMSPEPFSEPPNCASVSDVECAAFTTESL